MIAGSLSETETSLTSPDPGMVCLKGCYGAAHSKTDISKSIRLIVSTINSGGW